MNCSSASKSTDIKQIDNLKEYFTAFNKNNFAHMDEKINRPKTRSTFIQGTSFSPLCSYNIWITFAEAIMDCAKGLRCCSDEGAGVSENGSSFDTGLRNETASFL